MPSKYRRSFCTAFCNGGQKTGLKGGLKMTAALAEKSRDCRLWIQPPLRALTADKGGLFTADRITVNTVFLREPSSLEVKRRLRLGLGGTISTERPNDSRKNDIVVALFQQDQSMEGTNVHFHFIHIKSYKIGRVILDPK